MRSRKHLAVFLTLLFVLTNTFAYSQYDAEAFTKAQQPTTREFSPVQEGFSPQGDQVLLYAPDRLLVQFHAQSTDKAGFPVLNDLGDKVENNEMGIESIDELADLAGVVSIERPYIRIHNADKAADLGVDRWFLYRFAEGADVVDLAAQFRADKSVQSVSLDYVAFPAAVPNDPMYADHWGHNNTAQLPDLDWGGTYEHDLPNTVGTPGFDANAPGAWDGSQGYGSSSIVIAIIDSGVDVGHPDLRQVTGYDFGDNDSNPDDDSASPGHGTACAGVAAAINNNGLGAVGIAGGCSIMPLKVANNAGSMYFSSIQNALYYAADNGADVISMSLGAAISSDSATAGKIIE